MIDLDAVQRAASLGCTYEELAVIIGIGKTQFYEHLDRDPSLKEAINEGRAVGRTTLRRQQWQRAEAGSDTMLIWLGKQLLGQKDKIDADVTIGTSDNLNHLFAARTIEALANGGNTNEPPTIDGSAETVADETKPQPPPDIFEPAAE